jgi:steroid 5-alpha reductase family enzyme
MIRLLPLWGAATVFLGLLMCAAWVVQRRTGQGGWADAFWSFGLGAAGSGVALALAGRGAVGLGSGSSRR